MHRSFFLILLAHVPLFSCMTSLGSDSTASAPQTTLSRRLGELARDTPLCVGHRGAAQDFPENTLPSFMAALAAGADMVELDFHQSADGILICMHDATLDRTTDIGQRLGRKEVKLACLPAAQTLALDAGSWKDPRFAGTPPPTLEQALDVIQAGSITMIEHKGGEPEKLIELLRNKNLIDEVLVQSFDWDFLEAVHQLEPSLTIGALGGEELTDERLVNIRRTGASMVHWNGQDLAANADAIAKLRRRSYLICVYTVNKDEDFLRANALGVDAITTDRPARLIELIEQGKLRR